MANWLTPKRSIVMPVLSLLYAVGPALAYLAIVAPLWRLVGLGMRAAGGRETIIWRR